MPPGLLLSVPYSFGPEFWSSCPWFMICLGCSSQARCIFRLLRNPSQSTSQKLWKLVVCTTGKESFSCITTGRWSIFMLQKQVSVLQTSTRSSEWFDKNTWSNCDHFFITWWQCVGIPLGRMRSIPSDAVTGVYSDRLDL